MKKLKYTLRSTAFRLFAVISIVVIPIIILLIYSNYQSRSTLLEQVRGTHENMLQTYCTQIDRQLSGAAAYTVNLAAYENDSLLALSNDEATSAYAVKRLMLGMDERMLSESLVDGYFWYSEQTAKGPVLITSFARTISAADRAFINQYVSQFDTLLPDMRWHTLEQGGYRYLVQQAYSGDGVFVGAFISVEQLLNRFAPGDVEGSQLLYLTGQQPASADDKDHLRVAIAAEQGDFSLVEAIPRAQLLGKLPFLQKYVVAVTLLLLLLIPLLFIFLHRIVVGPLLRLAGTMEKVGAGDLDYRIEGPRSSAEFQMVNSTFNRMMDEVQHLKIDIYEKELQTKKAQLRNLQLQLNPHFLINSFNMVYNLIQNENLATARQFILHSVDYLRYMVKIDKPLVPLNEELFHVKSYLEIQSIRYEGKFRYELHTDPMVDDMLVPPLLVQNFAENAIKYAVGAKTITTITITVSAFEQDYFPYAKIMIADTGNGYPEELLARLNQGLKIQDERGGHIGIYNSVQRIRMLFGEKGRWQFYNQEGAVCEIVLPATFAENDDEGLDENEPPRSSALM